MSIVGIQDVIEEYNKLEKKKASETEQLKKELAHVMEKVSLIEREQKTQNPLDDQIKQLAARLQEVEARDKERERTIEKIQQKYKKEMEQLTTEYKRKLHTLEEEMQRECTDVFAKFNSKF